MAIFHIGNWIFKGLFSQFRNVTVNLILGNAEHIFFALKKPPKYENNVFPCLPKLLRVGLG